MGLLYSTARLIVDGTLALGNCIAVEYSRPDLQHGCRNLSRAIAGWSSLSGQRRLGWFDRSGKPLATLTSGEGVDAFSLSPDGRRIGVYLSIDGSDTAADGRTELETQPVVLVSD